MIIKQISVFVENGVGGISEITKILSDNNINIRSAYVADTAEFGILRLIVTDTKKAEKVLGDSGIAVKETDVIAVEMSDTPGGLGGILDVLSDNGVNIEYLYAFVGKGESGALMVFKADDAQKAETVLENSGIVDINATSVYDSLK
ncbi:MAG: ACT domain-containing protein [Eubacteriales bacterium]|nr:ACT domain-containing protein [Eubacteriales bacterium]